MPCLSLGSFLESWSYHPLYYELSLVSLFRTFELLHNKLLVPEIVYHLSYTCADFSGEEV